VSCNGRRGTGLPPEQVITELKETLRRSKVLSDKIKCHEALLESLCAQTEIGLIPIFLNDFEEMCWKIACASGRSPESQICRAEIQSHAEYPEQNSAEINTMRCAETLRLIAGFQKSQTAPPEANAKERMMQHGKAGERK
jgi:hypothetical protein